MTDGIFGWENSAKSRYRLERPSGETSEVEEPFNDRIIEVLERSLEYGPRLLNAIQPIDFDETAEITYDQRDLNGTWDRQPDITIVDSRRAVAYESKRGSEIDIEQLEGEYRQLVEYYNRDDYAVVLVTEHNTRPRKIDDCDCEVEWISWYDIARGVEEYTPRPDSAQEELRKVLLEVFKLEDMHAQFTGFEDAHPRQLDYFIRDIWYGAPRTETFEDVAFMDRRPKNLEQSIAKSWRPIGQKYYELALHRPDWSYYPDWGDIEQGDFARFHPCIIVNRGSLESPVEVYAGVSANPYEEPEIKRYIRENQAEIADFVRDERAGVIFADNTLTHTDEEMDPNLYTDEEIQSLENRELEDRIEMLFDESREDYRRIILYHRVSSPESNLVPRTITTVEEITNQFRERFPELCTS